MTPIGCLAWHGVNPNLKSYIKMYLDVVFIRHPNICIVPRMELICVFQFLSKKSLEIKKRLKELDRVAHDKSFSNLLLKLSTIFILKMCFLKISALAFVYSFECNYSNTTCGKTKHHFYVRTADHIGILYLKQLSQKCWLRIQLFQVICWLLSAT